MEIDDRDEWLASTRSALRPPPRLSLSAWADKFFYLSAESAAEPGRWKTLPYQRGIMDAITDPAVDQVSMMKSARIGYALSLDTPLPTPTGWTTMGEVSNGDLLMGADGKPCRVVCKSQVYVDHQCYTVRFCDGSEIVADAGHEWLVESDVSLEHLASGAVGRTGRPKPGEVRSMSGVIDTETMARCLHTYRGRNALAIANADSLILPDANLLVPPYTMGLWLGDGNCASPRITQHRPDIDETASFIASEGIRTSVRFIDSRHPDNGTIFLDVPDKGRPVSPWAAKFRALDVLGSGRSRKHIPACYLRASASQRIELLRGLMDSDGTMGTDGRAEFTNTNKLLCDGVYELVVSLGMKATIRYRVGGKGFVRGKLCNKLPQWRVNFKPTPETNPCNLARKADRVKAAAKPTVTHRRRIVSVESSETVPVQCVQVDNDSHLYLAGRQMIPTHNTKMIDAAIGYYMHQDPCPMMVVQPTVEDAQGFSKEEIAPMLRDCKVLSDLVLEPTSRVSESTILHKSFAGGSLSMVGANSGRGFRRVSRRVVMFDEVDGYPSSAGSEGDPIKLGTKRTEYYWNRKIIAGSTPLIAGASRIEEMFEAGDQRRYHVPCPHCEHKDILVFRKQEDGRGHYMQWPDGEPESAYFVCSANGCAIEHDDKFGMLADGEWIAEAEFTGHASFHIWAAYSMSPNASWGHLATEFLEASKGGPEKLQTFVNTALGETWKARGEAPGWEKLYNRREQYKIGSIPDGVVILTAGVDVQKDRFVFEVVGWAPNKESWSIDAGILHGDTSDPATWAQLDELLGRNYDSLSISCMAVDSGYNTQQVYSWCRRYPMSRVIAIKGSATAKSLVGVPSPVEITVSGKRMSRGYKMWPIGVAIGKAELYGWLRLDRAAEGEEFPPGYCHFPEYAEEFFLQLTAEHLVTVKKKTGFASLEWQMIPGRENHWLDARVYARAAASVKGLDRARTSQPPPRKPASSAPAKPSERSEKPAAPAPAPAPKPKRKASNKGSWLKGGKSPGGWLGKRRG